MDEADSSSTTPLVTRQTDLERYCRTWRELGTFAFDTEFIRDETYESALCLVQVAANGSVVLVDPTARLDMSPFWELVTDPAVRAVVHAGKEDFEVCLRVTGQPPRNVFDVQIAAGLLGYGFPLNLSRLVSDTVGAHITKAQTLTDWLRRPLTDAQMRYAVEDVLHLPAVHARLNGELAGRGRAAWAEEEFRRFEDPRTYVPPVRERLFRLKGTKRLDGLGLAVLERLIEWRDAWAQQRNRPLRAMMRDDVLVEIARRRPKRASDLEVLRGFPQARNPRIIRELLEIIAQVRLAPKSQWPKPYQAPREAPLAKAMLDVLSAVARAVCEEEGVSFDLLGGAQRLREVLDYHAGLTTDRPALLTGWREQFLGGRLVDTLAGKSELHISGWPAKPRLVLVTHKYG